jgi:hypothetical protein
MGAGLSPCDGSLAARVDGDTGVRLSVGYMGGRDNLVEDEGRDGALRRGIEPEIAPDGITVAVEGGGVAKTFDGGT